MPPRLRRPLHIIPRILLNLVDLRGTQLHFVRFEPLGLLDQFPGYEDHREDADHEVGEEEVGDVPEICGGKRVSFFEGFWCR